MTSPSKCRITYVPAGQVWAFYSPYGLKTARQTFQEAVADLDIHLEFVRSLPARHVGTDRPENGTRQGLSAAASLLRGGSDSGRSDSV
jgi:hypothetical protein